MATAPNTGMDKAEMKKLLVRSKEEPVNCAIGLGKDQQAMVLLHKTKSPMALVKELEKLAGGALRAPCHGTALVDADQDPKLVVLTVNKAVGGLAAKLKKTLKGTGFTKATIRLEDGTVADSAEEDEAEEGAEGEEAAAPRETASDGPDIEATKRTLAGLMGQIVAAASDPGRKAALVKLAGDANAAIKAGDAAGAAKRVAELTAALEQVPTAPPPPPAADGLRKELAALIARVAAVADAGAKARLAKLAGDANAALKAGDAATAAGLAQQLREGLDGGTAPAGKPLDIWRDAKDQAGAEISQLQQALRGTGVKLFEQIADQGLNAITGRLQVGLQAALMDVGNGGSKDKARAAVADFRSFLAADEVLPLLEQNPFGVKVTLRTELPRALDAIEKALAA
jgi:hypothetical protein